MQAVEEAAILIQLVLIQWLLPVVRFNVGECGDVGCGRMW
jgi:hypothetical protein